MFSSIFLPRRAFVFSFACFSVFFLICVFLALQTARILLFCSRLPDEIDVPEEIVSAADDAEDLRDPALEVLGEPAAEDLRDPAADDFFELPREEGAGV